MLTGDNLDFPQVSVGSPFLSCDIASEGLKSTPFDGYSSFCYSLKLRSSVRRTVNLYKLIEQIDVALIYMQIYLNMAMDRYKDAPT